MHGIGGNFGHFCGAGKGVDGGGVGGVSDVDKVPADAGPPRFVFVVDVEFCGWAI